MLEKVNLKLQIKLMKFTNLKFWRKKRRKTISPSVKLFPRVKLFRLLPPPGFSCNKKNVEAHVIVKIRILFVSKMREKVCNF